MQILELARVDARISTESLMTSLMTTLEDAASKLTVNVEHRIDHLKTRIAGLEAEVDSLTRNGLKPLTRDAWPMLPRASSSRPPRSCRICGICPI